MASFLAVCAAAAALLVGGAIPASAADSLATGDAGAAGAEHGPGTLELKSEPGGAEVAIDGTKTGQRTPATPSSALVLPLTSGQHQLTVFSPEPKRFKDRSMTITIVAGKPTRLTIQLAKAAP
jgi:hypothetical protein